MQTLNIISGGTSAIFHKLFKSKLADGIQLVMVAGEGETGAILPNIQIAKHGLSYIAIVGNRELIPFIALEPSLAVNDYLRKYLMAMESKGNATGRNTRERRTTQSAPG